MAELKIFNTVTLATAEKVLYDQQANQLLQVYLEDSGEEALSETPVAGKYAQGAWEIFGPDGEEVFLLGVDNEFGLSGSMANRKIFTPPYPGRWLVRFTTQQYVLNDSLEVVLSDNSSVFTALYEIQDPNIIGHRDARPYGNGSVTRGTSVIAPNETTEYDSDEGWSRGIERYLTTVSREQGFRSTAVVLNDSGVQIDAGYVCSPPATDPIQNWKNAFSSLQDFQNTICRVELAQSSFDTITTRPLFIALEDIPSGERGVVLVEGSVPFDTGLFAEGARLFVASNGELTDVIPSTTVDVDAGDDPLYDRFVGHVSKHGQSDLDSSPGVIYFHGHTASLPGLVSGPLSSTHNAIATWDGTLGNKLQSSGVNVFTTIGAQQQDWIMNTGERFTIQAAQGTDPLEIKGSPSTDGTEGGEVYIKGGSPGGEVNIQAGGGNGFFSSGGDATFEGGSSNFGEGGDARVYGGTVGAATTEESGRVYIRSGHALGTGNSGLVTITSGNVKDAAAEPGHIIIRGGQNEATDEYGAVWIQPFRGPFMCTASYSSFSGQDFGYKAKHPTDNTLGEKLKIKVEHDYGVNTNFFFVNEAGTTTALISTDAHSWFRGKLAVGTDAEPAAHYQFHLEGDGNVQGDFRIDGKLDVTGLIDPTGLILTPIDDLSEITDSISPGEAGIFVAGPGLAGFTEGDLYYTDSTGAVTASLTETVAAGTALDGPFAAGSTEANQVAVWAGADGDEITGGQLLINADGSISSITSAGVSRNIKIVPSDHTAGGDISGADVLIVAGEASGAGDGGTVQLRGSNSTTGLPGGIQLSCGSSDSVIKGGSVEINSGFGGRGAAGLGDGGDVVIHSGDGGKTGGGAYVIAGSSLNDVGTPSDGVGGSVIITSGVGGRNALSSGNVEILGSDGAKGSFADGYRGGSGGGVIIRGGMAGTGSAGHGGSVHITAGDAESLDPAVWGVGDAGEAGEVQIRAGNSPNTVAAHAHFKPGANVTILAGDAGANSSGDGGNIVLEPGAIDPAHPMPWIGHQGIIHLCGAHDAAGDQKSHVAIGSQVASGFGAAIGDCFGQTAHTIHGFVKITGGFDPTCIYVDPQTENPVIQYLTDAYDKWEAEYSVERVTQIESAIASVASRKTVVEEAKSSAVATLAGLPEGEVDLALEDTVSRLEKELVTLTSLISKLTADKIAFETPPIDVASPEGQRFINHTMWFKQVLDAEGNHVEDRMMMGNEPVGTRGTIEYDEDTVVYDDALAISDGHLGDGDGPTGKVMYYTVPSTTGVVLVDSTVGDVAVMLPDPTLHKRRSIYVKDMAGQSNVPGKGQIYIVPPSGFQLDQYTYSTDGDAAGPYPVQPWASRQCYSNGTNWFLI